jgi:hypothetical protein
MGPSLYSVVRYVSADSVLEAIAKAELEPVHEVILLDKPESPKGKLADAVGFKTETQKGFDSLGENE